MRFTLLVNDGKVDSAPDTVTVSVLAVNDPPQFPVEKLSARNWTQNTAIAAFTVPADRAGTWTIAIDGTPNAGSDWDLQGDGGRRSASRNADERFQVTLTAGQTYNFRVFPFSYTHWTTLTEMKLTLTPPASTGPVCSADTLGPYTWIQGVAIEAFSVPQATGGEGPLTYTAAGLPAGVTMAPNRIVSGTPTEAGSGTATVTATDADGDFARLTFEWGVFASAPVLSANPNPSTTGDFTVSWTAFRTTDEEYFLVETALGGGTTSHEAEINQSRKFIAKPDGTYTYQMRGCRTEYDRDTEAEKYRCVKLGNALTVTVDGPAPDSVSTQLNYSYTAHAGDFDGNGHDDLLIKRTSAGVGAGIFQTVVLSQKTRGQLSLIAPSAIDVMTASAYPVASNVSLVLGDYNLDGFVDVLLRGLGSAITGALDQIVYAPGGKAGGYPVILNAVDDEFTKFLTQVNAWIDNPAYFDNNALSTTSVQSPGFAILYHCQEAETGNNYYTDYPCPLHDIPIGEIYEPFTNVVTVISYQNLNDDALEFSRQFSLVDGRINPDVTLGSQRARNLSKIFEDVFGVEFFDGKLEQACSGTLTYDANSSLPCDGPTLIGRILLGLINTLIPPAQAQDSSNINTQLPEPMPGLVGYGSNFPASHGGGSYRNGQYGTATTIESLEDLGERWLEKYPSGPPIAVGDISREGGAAWPPNWHEGHRDGKNVDMRPLRKDGINERVRYDDDVAYDQAKTQELINEIEKDDNVCAIWFNDPRITSERIVIRSDPRGTHDNHIHVQYCE